MATIEKGIEVNAPLRTCYNQWSQFESLPRIMKHVLRVTRIDDRHYHWKIDVGGKVKEWQAEVTLMEPDHAIGWRSVAGADLSGRVNFHAQDTEWTEISMRLVYLPENAAEYAAEWLGRLDRAVEEVLQDFKEFVERRKVETGAWRGEIHGDRVEYREVAAAPPGPVPLGQEFEAAEPDPGRLQGYRPEEDQA